MFQTEKNKNIGKLLSCLSPQTLVGQIPADETILLVFTDLLIYRYVKTKVLCYIILTITVYRCGNEHILDA